MAIQSVHEVKRSSASKRPGTTLSDEDNKAYCNSNQEVGKDVDLSSPVQAARCANTSRGSRGHHQSSLRSRRAVARPDQSCFPNVAQACSLLQSRYDRSPEHGLRHRLCPRGWVLSRAKQEHLLLHLLTLGTAFGEVSANDRHGILFVQKGPKHPVPNNEHSSEVLVHTAVMVDTMVARCHQDPLNWSWQATDKTGVDPKLRHNVGLIHCHVHGSREKESHGQVVQWCSNALEPRLAKSG
mmetsp:Transcript_40796/g.95302  ORF Transcript_40796/g.95302 Transcript_40796/m.95302 type:complete len:240 (+) Transcript_40796:336-1055(+)